jgi:hypothetical protein
MFPGRQPERLLVRPRGFPRNTWDAKSMLNAWGARKRSRMPGFLADFRRAFFRRHPSARETDAKTAINCVIPVSESFSKGTQISTGLAGFSMKVPKFVKG